MEPDYQSGHFRDRPRYFSIKLARDYGDLDRRQGRSSDGVNKFGDYCEGGVTPLTIDFFFCSSVGGRRLRGLTRVSVLKFVELNSIHIYVKMINYGCFTNDDVDFKSNKD